MTTNLKHLDENLKIFDFEISEIDSAEINKLNYQNIRDVKNISKYEWDE